MRPVRSDERQLTLVGRGIRPTALIRGTAQLKGCVTISDWLVSTEPSRQLSAPTVVHLAEHLNPADGDYERANILPTQRVASAVSPVRTRSLVFLAMSAPPSNQRIAIWPQRRAPSLASGNRRLWRYPVHSHHWLSSSPGRLRSLLPRGKASVTVLGKRQTAVAPVYLGDVVAAIEAAIISGQAGTFDLQGPEEMTFDDLVRRLNGLTKVSIAHVPAVLAHALGS